MINQNFFIKELPGMVEMLANTIQGLSEGIEYLIESGYKINHESSTVIGINYLIYGVKKTKTEANTRLDNQQVMDLMDEVDALTDDLSETEFQLKETKLNLKKSRSECTKLKTKIKKK